MADDESLDEVDERVFAFIKSFDFEKYPWSTAEAAAELGLAVPRVYQALTRIQKLKKRDLFVYYREGALHIQTD